MAQTQLLRGYAMKKHTAVCLVLSALSSFTFGQKPETAANSVIWGEDAGCHPANSEAIKALKPQCSKVQVDTVIFYIATVDGVSYAMSYRPVRDFLVASVQISNKSGEPLQLRPSRSRLGHFQSPQAHLTSAGGDFVVARSQGDLRQAVFHESTVIGEKDGEVRSGLRLREKFERNVERGRIIQRTNRNEAAPPPTEGSAPSIITSSLLVPRAIFDNVLKSKTLAAGEKTAGHLVFKDTENEKSFRVLFLNAGKFEFVFPVTPN